LSAAPRSNADLFWTFTKLALQGFGGVLPVAERVLVHERRWMTSKDFVESLAVAQALPGPNVVNLCLMVGDRFSGARGAASALAGMMFFPMVLVLALASVYQYYAHLEITRQVLLGMAAVSVGLIGGMGLRLVKTQGHYRVGWLVGTATFGLIALAHARLGFVILALGIPSFLFRWWQIVRARQGDRGAA
jgi:chromate transporter